MKNKISVKGEWYFASNEEKKFIGDLNFDQEKGGVLELIDNDQDLATMIPIVTDDGKGNYSRQEPTGLPEKIIIGRDLKGTSYTLVANFVKKHTLRFSGSGQKEILLCYIFVGIAIPDIENYRFPLIQLKISGLFEWIGRSNLFIDRDHFFTEEKGRHTLVSFTINDPIIFQLENGIKLTFDKQISPSIKGKESNITQLDISQDYFAKIEKEDGLTFKEIIRLASHIRTFISFGLDQPCYIEVLNFEVNDEIGLENGSLFYQQSDYKEKKHDEFTNTINQKGYYFIFDDIQTDFERIFSNYLKKMEEYKNVLRAFFSTKDKNFFFDIKFMNHIETFEALHRMYKGGEYLDKETYMESVYKKLIDAIPENINNLIDAIPEKRKEITPEDEQGFKDKLKGSMEYLYEYSLAKRIKQFLEEYKDYFSMETAEIKKVSQKIKNTRNYYAHGRHEDSLNAYKDKPREFYNTGQFIEEMLGILVFEILGFPREKILSFLENKRKKKWEGKIL